MPSRAIPYAKALVHILCLIPLVFLIQNFRHDNLGADPVNTVTHATGNWALWILLLSLAVTPIRRLNTRLSNLIRFRRLLGLYAFFYVALHLATYVFLFSGYDLPAALAGLKAGHPGAVITQWKVIWPDILADLLKRRFIQVGLASSIILLALALTSPTVVLRKMGGKNWARLHRLVYIAAFTACVHYWWLVKAGVRAPLPDTLVLFALLLARVAWHFLNPRRKPKIVPQQTQSA